MTNNTQWLALYTRARHEKHVARDLTLRHIRAFLPLVSTRRRWSDRTVTVEEPLFKSYIFVQADPQNAREALKAKGAVSFVSAAGRPVAIPESVIGSLQAAVTGGTEIELFPYLRTGDRVYVRAGIFKGMEGFVVRKDEKKCRVVISIDALMASASLEVDAALVENLSS